jgi:hypothetical protein
VPLQNPIAAAAATPSTDGYWFTDSTGEVTAFGGASYYGSAPSPLNKPIVGMAEAAGTGAFVGAPYPSGSYGYDVSNYQCSSIPSGNHDVSIVQVDGIVDPDANDSPNPCLSTEATWAGAGLNLYTFLGNYSTDNGQGDLCDSTTSCFDQGEAAGMHAFQDAQAAGVNTDVGWWLDVEGTGQYWTASTADNAATIQGAIDALHNTEHLANVGIYASPGTWNQIVGDFQPAVPYWAADWLQPPSGPGSCADIPNQIAAHAYQLPTGPVEIVQYNAPGDNVGTESTNTNYDEDYAC